MGSMPTTQADRKESKPCSEVTADDARLRLGDLIDRAGFGNERFVITRHGKRRVAIISIDDLDALEKSEAA